MHSSLRELKLWPVHRTRLRNSSEGHVYCFAFVLFENLLPFSFYHHFKCICLPSTPSRSVVLGKGLIFLNLFFYFIFFSSGCRLLILILFPSTPSRSLVLGGWGWLTQSGMARPAQGSPLVKYPRWGRGPVARSKYWIWRLVNNLRRVVSIQLLYFTCVWYGLKSLCLVNV